MSGFKFLRKYRLTIGQPNSSDSTSTESVVIEDLHIEFDIKVTGTAKLNTLDLKIYNLSKSTIAVFNKKDVLVSLEVGWVDSPLTLLFRGDKTMMQTTKQGTEIITHVLAAEAYVSVREGRHSVTIGEGSTVEDVIKGIVKEGFPDVKTVSFSGDGAKRKYPLGFSSTGNTKKALDDLCASNNLNYTIEKGDTMYIYPKNGAIKYEAVVISPSTGLISTPEVTNQEIRHLKKDLDVPPDDGVKFKCMLDPLLKAGALVKIEDTFEADGVYRVDKISHSGRYESDEWVTDVECVTLD